MEDKDIMEQEEIVEGKVSDFQADIISMALLMIITIIVLSILIVPFQEMQGLSFSIIMKRVVKTVLKTDIVTFLVFIFCLMLSLFIIWEDSRYNGGRELEEQLIGIFPAVGMWGTFFGVAQSLVGFNATGENLNALIAGFQTAVYTTVIGMTFFLWWSVTLMIKEKILVKNEEQDPALVILNNISKEMTGHMERLANDINENIGEILGKELRNFSEASKQLLEWYQQGMTKYTKSLKEMDSIYQKIQDTLSTLSQEISETLQSMSDTNTILENRNEMLTQQGELTEKWVENVKEVNDSVIQTSKVLNESLSQYQDRFSTALEEASKAVIVNIQQLSEQYRTYFDERQKYIENMSNTLDEERKENMDVLKREIDSQLMYTKTTIENYMAGTLTVFSEQMRAIANNYHENILATLGETTKGHKEGFEQLHENLQKTNEFIKNSQENLNGTFDQINSLMDKKIKLLEKKISKSGWSWSSSKKHEADE